MPYINREKILNESPTKRLIIGFNNLKQNFTKEAALEYSNLYKDQSLSFIIENSRMIFSEPYYGLEFYKEAVAGENDNAVFHKYKDEINKLDEFISDNQNKMPVDQLQMYLDLRDSISSELSKHKNSEVVVGHAIAKDKQAAKIADEISDKLYDYKKAEAENNINGMTDVRSRIRDTMTNMEDPSMFFTLAPYVTQGILDNSILNENLKRFASEPIEDWTKLEAMESAFDNVVILSKLVKDSAYCEAVNTIPYITRVALMKYATESVRDNLNELITERVSSDEAYYSTPMMAVLNLFNSDTDSIIYKEEYDEFRNSRYNVRLHVFESMMDLITYEYQNCDDTNAVIDGYNFFDEGTTIEQAFDIISKKLAETKATLNITEASDDEDVSDDDINNMENDVNDVPEREGTVSKKPEAPKPKNLANKIQFKAMDAEVKQNKMRAAAKQRGQEMKNAARAAAQLPANVISDIRDQTHKLDEADDDRRKKYMLEPGFRKKAVRNLKLAVLYGGAARAKLALVPVVAICRHFSKIKNIRIRNELARELDTEIKITEEKISDANAAGDNKEKYQLMRIKSKLEAEKTRVRLNTKYI